jgi:hypothetical protein
VQLVWLERRFQLTRHQKEVATLISCSDGGMVYWWDALRGHLLWGFNALDPPNAMDCITAMAVDAASTTLVTGDSQGWVRVWDIAAFCNGSVGGRPRAVVHWRAHGVGLTALRFLDVMGVVVTASNDCACRIWSTEGDFFGTFGASTWVQEVPLEADLDEPGGPEAIKGPEAKAARRPTLAPAGKQRRMTVAGPRPSLPLDLLDLAAAKQAAVRACYVCPCFMCGVSASFSYTHIPMSLRRSWRKSRAPTTTRWCRGIRVGQPACWAESARRTNTRSTWPRGRRGSSSRPFPVSAS